MLVAVVKTLLCLLAALFVLQSHAQTQTVAVVAYSRSLTLNPATANNAGNAYTLYFTTTDKKSGLPLYQPTAGGGILVSSEARPSPTARKVYDTDYLLLLNGLLQQYGTLSMTVPTVDTDKNGIYNLTETSKSLYASVTGSGYSTWPSSNYLQFSARFSRDAGSPTGVYSGTLAAPGATFLLNGTLRTALLQGTASYSRGQTNLLQWQLTRTSQDGTNTTLLSSTRYIVNSASQVTIPRFQFTNSIPVPTTTQVYVTNFNGGDYGTNMVVTTNLVTVTNQLVIGYYTVSPVVLTRKSNHYAGRVTFTDGALETPWTDYTDWMMELTDLQDSNGNGVPDFSDPALGVSTSRFSLTISGDGTVSPNLNGQDLELGKTYMLTARPATGCLFSNWTGSIEASTRVLSFVMQSNLVLQANFVPNLFYPARGTYRGLITTTNGPAPETAGYITALTTDKARYSAKLQVGGRTYSVSGAFDASGRASRSLPKPDGGTLSLQLQLDLTGAKLLLGSVSDGAWSADITAKTSPYNARLVPCPFAGKYTLAVAPQGLQQAYPGTVAPGTPDADSSPAGYGCGIVTVDANGRVKLTGSLADGSPMAQTTALSAQGEWPLYVCLYRGRGWLQTWLTFTNQADRSAAGTLTWLKGVAPGDKYYPAGFTNQAPFTLAPYHAPWPDAPVLNWTNGSIYFAGGNLPADFANDMVLRPDNSKFANAGTNKLTFNFSRSTGLFHGTVTRPGATQRFSFQGVMLQPMLGCGYFLGANLSGLVLLGQPGVPAQPSTNLPPVLPPGTNRPLPQLPLVGNATFAVPGVAAP